MERVRQGRDFVAALLDRVIGLLLKSLQEQLAHSAALRADLGLPDIFPVPVRAALLSWGSSLLTGIVVQENGKQVHCWGPAPSCHPSGSSSRCT